MRLLESRQCEPLDLLDSWASWREASDAVHAAYRWWSECATPNRSIGYAMYRLALDRERDAANALSDRAARAGGRGPLTHPRQRSTSC